MPRKDVIVIGGGVSGACFAYHAARSGGRVQLVERESRDGGCLHSVRVPGGYWFELGAHTCYNSYGALLEVLEGCGLLDRLQPRAKPALRFLDGDRVVPGKNLGLLIRLFGKLELLRALPRWFSANPDGRTVREHYSSLVGEHNYERVLGPMLSAVPSQTADAFPADMLFKKRERRKDVIRSFTLRGGLQSAVEGILEESGAEVHRGSPAARVERTERGYAVTLEDGRTLEAELLALGVPPGEAASLLKEAAPEVAAEVAGIGEARIDSLGFAVPATSVDLPFATFFIPMRDEFHSVVTRDVVPDPDRRAFTFHFRPGLTEEARLERAARLLGIEIGDMQQVTQRSTVLPSPVLGHADRIAALDDRLAGSDLALTGNWFSGLSIEDCAQRSRSEWRRLEAAPERQV